MVHIMYYFPVKEFGKSGLLRDGNGDPLEFEDAQAAQDFIDAVKIIDAKIVEVGGDKPVNVHNPGDVPQVGSKTNPAKPGDQVHPISMEFDKYSAITPAPAAGMAIEPKIEAANREDDEKRAKLLGSFTGAEEKSKADAKAKREAAMKKPEADQKAEEERKREEERQRQAAAPSRATGPTGTAGQPEQPK